MYIVVVNGFPQSGKTTFEQCVQDWITREDLNQKCYILSTIDCVKEIAKKCGWNCQKTPRSRKFLSDLKDLMTEYNDYPIRDIEFKLMNIRLENPPSKSVIFIDCREPDEIQKLVDRQGAITVLVRRAPTAQATYSNHADAEVLEYSYDYIIENNGNLNNLFDNAITFIEDLYKKDPV